MSDPRRNQPPINISDRLDIDTIAYIDQMPPPSLNQNSQLYPSQLPSKTTAAQDAAAGVLRRNQACLACRRRKLKCNAARPHCATCVRSHKHLLRTAPRSNPVLSCDYDDMEDDRGRQASSGSVEEEDEEGKKRKRKITDVRRKRKDDDPDAEKERLAKRVEELERALARKSLGTSSESSFTDNTRPWAGSRSNELPVTAPSPTAFLDLLSSAATSQLDSHPVSANGLRSGAKEDAMMSSMLAPSPGAWVAAMEKDKSFNGMYSFDNTSSSSSSKDIPQMVHQDSIGSGSSRPSTQGAGGSAPSPFHFNTDTSSSGISALSPNGIFNFSPGPTGPLNNWAPPPQPALPEGRLMGATSNEGHWRSIETTHTVFEFSTQTDAERLAAAADEHHGGTGMKNASHSNSQGQGQGLDAMGSMSFDQSIDIDNNGDANLFSIDDNAQQQLFLDLFWPGWPTNLPEPPVVNDLIEGFFELVPNLPRLLHKGRLQARMALPPTHSNFPHPGLIHAICAAASSWCPPSVWGGDYGFPPNAKSAEADKTNLGFDKFPKVDNKPNQPFGARQAAFAKEAIQDGLNTGNRLFDVVRAMIILSRVFIDDTRMLECWAYCGLVARMILPLGLNVRSAELSLKSVMLPPPADALEREERRAVIWMALYHDTIASSASGWGTSMSLEELSVPLPVSADEFEAGSEQMSSNPQDLESPDIWIKHPVADPFVMVLKATVIMNRVNRFARKWKNRHLRVDDDLDGMQRSEFRELANAIACLQMSFPPSLRNPCKLNAKKKLDIDLIAAHMLPHAAIICLYEPFADITDPNDAAARRLLNASQAVVSIVQQLASRSSDSASDLGSVMHSSASVCLVTAARTALIFYRQALNVNDQETADSLKMDVETIGMALGQFGVRFKIGQHHAQLIEYFLDRATNPTVEKLAAHYPEHPRAGAPELHPGAHLGMCVLNALNIKRGFWKVPTSNTGISPFGSTPDSETTSARNLGSNLNNGTSNSRRSSSGGGGGGGTGTQNLSNLNNFQNNPLPGLGCGSGSGSGSAAASVTGSSGMASTSASVTTLESESPPLVVAGGPGFNFSSNPNKEQSFVSLGRGFFSMSPDGSGGFQDPNPNLNSIPSNANVNSNFGEGLEISDVNGDNPDISMKYHWLGGSSNQSITDLYPTPWFVDPNAALQEHMSKTKVMESSGFGPHSNGNTGNASGNGKANGVGIEAMGMEMGLGNPATTTGVAEANYFMDPESSLKEFKAKFGIDVRAGQGI